MTREVRFRLEDDQFAQLDRLKERCGYTWKGLMIEGAQTLDENVGVFADRDRLEEKVEDIREEFGDREHHSTFRISSIRDERSGEEHLGIHVRLMDKDDFRLASDLEDIDRSLYDDGYNTAWASEQPRPEDDTLAPEGEYRYEGAIAALLIERGVPEIPDINSAGRKPSSHQNIH